MSKRERSIAIAVGLAMAILLLDTVLIEPLIASRNDLIDKVAKARDDLDGAHRLIRSQGLWVKNLEQAKSNGLMQDQDSAAIQMNMMLGTWATNAGVEVTSYSPGSSAASVNKIGGKTKEAAFQKLNSRIGIKGSMQQIAKFVYLIQTSEIPLRVNSLNVDPEKEGQDALKVEMEVSTIFLSSEQAANSDAARSANPPSSTRPGNTAQTRPSIAGAQTRPAMNVAGASTQPSGPIIPNAGSLSVEEQLRMRRLQETQPQQTAVASPTSNPTTRETR